MALMNPNLGDPFDTAKAHMRATQNYAEGAEKLAQMQSLYQNAMQQMQAQQMQAQQINGLGNSQTSQYLQAQASAYQSPVRKVRHLRASDFDGDAAQMPLTVCADMWAARFGGEWVKEALCVRVADEDPVWALIYHRLSSVGKLEKLYMSDTGSNVYRLIAD